MEARALAAGGDAAGADRALLDAERAFERRQPSGDPEFFTYFNDAERAAEFSHRCRDTGRFADAVTYARQGLTGSVRSDFFVTMVQAAGHLGTGGVEQACNAVRQALDVGAALRSARCVEYVRNFRQQVSGPAGLTAVRELSEFASAHPLWLASAHARRP